MSPETLQWLSVGAQFLQILVIPAVWFVGKALWSLDRRLYAVELKLGVEPTKG